VICDTLPTVRGNATRLGLVFQNLIANALKYRSEAPPRIHIGTLEVYGTWVVSVEDNGVGFDQAYAEQLFGLFKRLNNEPAGTGLVWPFANGLLN
jgi:light-regulated signal transduction histidine kinase (bacteriophytochrome)